jgi:plastocyanin
MRATWIGVLGGGLVFLGILAMIAGAAVQIADRGPAAVVVAGPAGVPQPPGSGSTGRDFERDGTTGDDDMGPGNTGGPGGTGSGTWGGPAPDSMGGDVGPGVLGSGPLASPDGTVTVSFDGLAFAPTRVGVRAGGTVTWRNDDTRIHSVAAADGSWSSGDLLPGTSFTRTFPRAGRFLFSSPDHPKLRGVVVVTP